VKAQEAESAGGATGSGARSAARRIQDVLSQRFGADAFRVVRTEAVGPRVGGELRRGALIAVLISFGLTLAYLAVRFEWRFGLAAVLATAHDVLATLAFVKLLNLEVSLTVIAAILTVIGYSLNDTIIIFDRVRENLRKHKGMPMYELVNLSVNETLPRSVMTHLTTLGATLALLLFAGDVIRPFAWVMSFGIFTGTFSSVYVASALLVWIERRYPRAVPARAAARPPVRPTSQAPVGAAR
jgi:preprotein translocase subunit SecF